MNGGGGRGKYGDTMEEEKKEDDDNFDFLPCLWDAIRKYRSAWRNCSDIKYILI